ncbi:MAG: YkgJ family cysteine cluster protein [Thermoproteota archaeon]
MGRKTIGDEAKKKHSMLFPRTMFKCILCRRCCEDTERGRRIVLTVSDALEILDATGISLSEFAEENNSEAYPYVIRLVNGRCFFLQPDRKCRIYPVRPLVCRFYPFMVQRIGKTYVFQADPSCHGLGKGTYLNEEYFEKLVEQAEERLNRFTGRFEAHRS